MKSLDIAASRTLSERDRIAELVGEIDSNRYGLPIKTISHLETKTGNPIVFSCFIKNINSVSMSQLHGGWEQAFLENL